MLSATLKSRLSSPISVIVNQQFDFRVNFSFNTFNQKFVAYLLISALMMLFIIATDARPQTSSHYSNNTPTSSKFLEQSFSREYEGERLTLTSTFPTQDNASQHNQTLDRNRTENVLRYNVNLVDSELSPPKSLSTVITSNEFWDANNEIDEPKKPESTLNRLEPATENSRSGNSQLTLSFLQQSRDAFLRLDSRSFVEPPLLPEEERRQIWLERHRHKAVEKLKRKKLLPGPLLKCDLRNSYLELKHEKDLPGRKRILALTSADLMNNNNSCTGDLFKHKIRMAGCEPKIIINRFCHGNCASFYIPKLRYKKLKATFQSCAACVPSEYDHVEVKLNCPGREIKELYRTVMRVKKCTCRNIELDDDSDDAD